MEKKKNIVDKAIEAFNKERVPAEPPESIVDATLEMLMETEEQLRQEESQKRLRTSEVLRASSRFARVALAAGIGAAVVLCAIFIFELTRKPEPEMAKEVEVQPLEELQDIEVEEEAIAIEEEAEPVIADPFETQMGQLRQMVEEGDVEGLRLMLREGEPEVQIAAAYYLGKMGDTQMVALLQELAAQFGYEPNETATVKKQDKEVAAESIVQDKIAQLKKDFKAKGFLSGLVLDVETGEPIEDAEVRIDKGHRYTQKTDVNGFYIFEDIEEAGNYRVGVWSDAYVGIYDRDKMPIINLGTEVNTVQHFELNSACIVEVWVANEEGEPIEGAELLASWLGEESGREVGQGTYSKRTDANGFMLLGGFEPSNTPYLITAIDYIELDTKPIETVVPKREINYAPGSLLLTLKDTNTVETGEIILRKGTRVRGYAEYTDGVPAGGLGIIAEPDWWHSARVAPRATIEPNGFFTLNHILQGTYNISIYFPREGRGGMSYSLQSRKLPPDEGLLSVLVPEKSPDSLVSISGTISYVEGKKPRHISISAYSRELGYRNIDLWEEMETFTIDRLEPGTYRLTFSGSNIEQKVIENVEAPSEGIEVELKYTVKPRLKGLVVKADTSEPLQQFKGRARKLRTLRGPNYVQSNKWVVFRGTGGELDIEVVGPGVYQVQVEAEGFAPQWSQEINTDVNEPVTIALSAGGSIKGRVVNENNEPVSEAKVIPLSKACGAKRNLRNEFIFEYGAVITKDGEYILEHISPGIETIKATHPEYSYAIAKDILVEEGEVTSDIEVTLSKGGGAEGYVYDLDGRAQANVTLYFRNDIAYGAAGDTAGLLATTITDSNGFYRVDGLPEQMCYISRSDPWSSMGVVRRAFLPEKGKSRRIDLGGGPVVSGELIVDGTRLPNKKLLLSSIFGGVFKCISITDSQGQFSFAGVPTGRHYIYYEKPQKKNGWLKVANLEIGSEDVDLGIIPEQSAQIEVYFVNESNEPNLKITLLEVQEGKQIWGERAGNVNKPETPDGPYVISNLIPGPYTVTASRADNVTIREYVDLSAGDQQLSIRIPSGTGKISGSFISDNQQYLVIWRVDKKVTGRIYPRTGNYKISNFPAGDYMIGNFLLFEKAPFIMFTLNDGETKTVDIDTEDFSAIGVSSLKTWVVDDKRVPITGATVWLEGDSGDIEPAMNPSIGQYFAAEPGEYILHAYYPGFLEATKNVLLEAGNIMDVDLDRKEATEFISLERQ